MLKAAKKGSSSCPEVFSFRHPVKAESSAKEVMGFGHEMDALLEIVYDTDIPFIIASIDIR
jgi:hypothetical protein